MSKTRRAVELGLGIIGAIAGNGAIIVEKAQIMGHFWASNIGIIGVVMMVVAVRMAQDRLPEDPYYCGRSVGSCI